MKTFLRTLLFVCAAALAALPALCQTRVSASGEHRYQNPAHKEFPVMAWFTLHGPHLDSSHFASLRDAGFNLAFSFLSDLEEVDRVLEGAQGIEYFTFQPWKVNSVIFHDAPIDSTGARTEVFYRVKKVNDEIHALTSIFLGAEVVNVGHTGSLPEGTRQFSALPKQVGTLEYSGDGLLVSHLRNGRKEYLLLVNRSLSGSQKVTLEFLRNKVRRIFATGFSFLRRKGRMRLFSNRGTCFSTV
ncbi:MAG: hypothetical protein ACI4TJ_00630 [Candidatus Cryptobacteroides sp.]